MVIFFFTFNFCFFTVPDDPRQVIVTKLAVLVEDHDDLELDLTGN